MTAAGFSKALKGGDSIDFVEAARLSGEGGELRGRESGQNLAAGAGTGNLGALYLYLFFRMLKENRERETRYQTTIASLSGSIASGIEKIQNKLDSMTAAQDDS